MIKSWIAVLIALASAFAGALGGLFWGAVGGGAIGGLAGVSAGAAIGGCATAEIARQKGMLSDAQMLEVLDEFRDSAIRKIRSIPSVRIGKDGPLEISDLDCNDVINDLK